MSLWPPRREDQAKLECSLAGASPKGRSMPPDEKRRLWSELLVSSQHVPDRVREAAGDVDLGDLGPALLAEPALCALVAVSVDRMALARASSPRSAPSAGRRGPCFESGPRRSASPDWTTRGQSPV